MPDELVKISATKLAALIRARKASPVDAVEAYLRRIEQLNPALNAVVTLAPDARERAREAEEAVMRGEELGALHGVPITIKDTIETQGLRTTSGSRVRAEHVPDEDATAVARLKRAGAILLGKTNVPEMAIPYECDNPVFGRANNPHDWTRTPGGSSGGEAAAIAACLSTAGLGSDLSGSIRVPAHFCGIVGLKPTMGRVPSDGHFPHATGAFALGAVIGPMARAVEDLSLLLNVLTDSHARAHINLAGNRFALLLDDEIAPVTDATRQAVHAAVRALCDAGLTLVEEMPPAIKRASHLWPALFLHASQTQLHEAYTGREEQAGALVRAVLNSSTGLAQQTLAAFTAARAERDNLRATLMEWMTSITLIIAPVFAAPAFEHGARRVEASGQEISVFRAASYARALNVLGLPSVSIPAGRSPEGLPLGIQIIGRPFEEERILAASSIIEEALGGWMPPRNIN
jgi:amidase